MAAYDRSALNSKPPIHTAVVSSYGGWHEFSPVETRNAKICEIMCSKSTGSYSALYAAPPLRFAGPRKISK